jgi:hypothetical protein
MAATHRKRKAKAGPATKTRATVRIVRADTNTNGKPVHFHAGARWMWQFYITDHLMGSSGETYTRARQALRAFERFRARVAQRRYVVKET